MFHRDLDVAGHSDFFAFTPWWSSRAAGPESERLTALILHQNGRHRLANRVRRIR